MQLSITFRQFGASEALKEHAREQVERVTKYLDGAGEAHVVLWLEGRLHHVDITVHAGPLRLRGHDKSENMYASIDVAMDKIERQLRRCKEKLKRHHGQDWVHHQQNLLRPARVPLFEGAPELEGTSEAEPAAAP